MAGDWTRHVIAGLGFDVTEPLKRVEAEYLWMQVLKGCQNWDARETRRYELSTDVPQLH